MSQELSLPPSTLFNRTFDPCPECGQHVIGLHADWEGSDFVIRAQPCQHRVDVQVFEKHTKLFHHRHVAS